VLQIALDVMREPMFLLLIAAGATYLALGDLQEALLLGGSIVFIIAITFYQQRKTERALEALRDLASPRALVIRAGEHVRIPGREVVRGDLVVLAEGDRVPADGVLRSVNDLLVDESLLTGESVPVSKIATDTTPEKVPPGGDGSPMVYSGTLVVRGQGVTEVQATGIRAALGEIGAAMQEVGTERTPLQRELGRLARVFALVGIAVCIFVIVVYGATRGDWLAAALVGITLAMSLLPEEIPVVLTVFLALGAWRIAQHQVLTRQVPAVEVLGAATVLCVDKTGTLTMNRMAVARLYANGEFVEPQQDSNGHLSSPFVDLVRYAVLASEPDTLDPTERAIVELGSRIGQEHNRFVGWQLVQEYPLTPEFPAMTHGWEHASRERLLAAKGAPEAILRLCRLDDAASQTILRAVNSIASDWLRVLGVDFCISYGF
jgi:Ca2+-transporting ATPase